MIYTIKKGTVLHTQNIASGCVDIMEVEKITDYDLKYENSINYEFFEDLIYPLANGSLYCFQIDYVKVLGDESDEFHFHSDTGEVIVIKRNELAELDDFEK